MNIGDLGIINYTQDGNSRPPTSQQWCRRPDGPDRHPQWHFPTSEILCDTVILLGALRNGQLEVFHHTRGRIFIDPELFHLVQSSKP